MTGKLHTNPAAGGSGCIRSPSPSLDRPTREPQLLRSARSRRPRAKARKTTGAIGRRHPKIAGEPGGKPILIHAGEPISRRLYLSDPQACRHDLHQSTEEILAATLGQFAGELERLLSPVEAEVLTGDLARRLTETHKVDLS
jgi:hypothetical protein